jgi:hypothetical protein
MLDQGDIHALEQDQLYYDAQEIARTELDRILSEAPLDRNTGGKVAIYSVRCCWWTSARSNVATLREFGKTSDLPCCPFCGSVLMEAELEPFVAAAIANPSHYGDWGLWTFARAHARQCFRRWSRYPPPREQAKHITPMRFG